MNRLFLYDGGNQANMDVYNAVGKVEQIRKNTIPLNMKNQQAYNIVTSSTNIQIQQLPVMFEYGDGKILKYEGLDHVTAYIENVVKSVAETDDYPQYEQEEEQEEEHEEYTTGATNISDLGFNPPPAKQVVTQPKNTGQTLPVKAKRSSKQASIIDGFVNSRNNQKRMKQKNDNSSPGSIKITSPKMSR